MFEWLGPAISAGSKILGGILGQNAAQETAEQNYANQVKFATNAIQWKVADAQRAGIHPLFALGASTHGYSNAVGDNSLGAGLADAGQDIGRAVSATGDRESRALLLRSAELDVEGKGLDNDIKRAELASRMARVAQAGNPPPMPSVTPTGDKVTDTTFLGMKIKANPAMSDTQKGTDRYGEGADYVYGPAAVLADEWHNRRRQIEYIGSLLRRMGGLRYISPANNNYVPF